MNSNSTQARKLINYYYPFLNKLSKGSVVIVFMHYFLKVMGILSLLGFLFLCYLIIDQTFANADILDNGSLLPIAGIILIIFAALLSYGIFQLYFYNADKIRQLGDSDFTIIPIVSILIRLTGEIIAYIAFLGGIAGFIIGLFISFGSIDLLNIFGSFGTAPVWVLLTGVFAAIGAIIIAYFWAEALVVSVDIARNVSKLSGEGNPTISQNKNTPVDGGILTCANCGTMLNTDDSFCTSCGHKVK